MSCIYTKQFSTKNEKLTEVEMGRLFDAILFYYHNPSITKDDKEDILSVAKKLLTKEEVDKIGE